MSSLTFSLQTCSYSGLHFLLPYIALLIGNIYLGVSRFFEYNNAKPTSDDVCLINDDLCFLNALKINSCN